MNCALSENNLCFAPNHEVKETIVAGVGAVASTKDHVFPFDIQLSISVDWDR